MIAEKVQYSRETAIGAAREIVRLLQPLAARLVIAGSLRRKKTTVGDVEVLYIPRWLDWPDEADMFGRLVSRNVTDHAIECLLAYGYLAKRPKTDGTFTWGPHLKLAVHIRSGVPVDFFEASVATWWCNLVCRTGPARQNTAIASAAQERGWTWHSTGEGFERLDGPDKGTIKVMRSEREIFDFVGMSYHEPEGRR